MISWGRTNKWTNKRTNKWTNIYSIFRDKLSLPHGSLDTPFLRIFQSWKMTHHDVYTNAELNSLLQQKSNETMPTIERTPLKINTPTMSTNKVDGTTAANPIDASIRKNLKRRNRKQQKGKKDKDAVVYNKILNLRRKITKN